MTSVYAFESWRHGAWITLAQVWGAAAAQRPAIAPPPRSPLVLHKNGLAWEIDALDTSGCVAQQVCTLELQIRPVGTWRLNESYPYKFQATAEGADLLGSGGGTDFSKSLGDWSLESGGTSGVMRVRLRPHAAATSSVITGRLRFVLCTPPGPDSYCKASTEELQLTVPVT